MTGRIIVHFTDEKKRISSHLQRIAWEVDQGRTFGAGWCLVVGGVCPVPGDKEGSPCEGNESLCEEVRPIDRSRHPTLG